MTCTRTACRGAGAGAGGSSTMISTYRGSWGRGTPPGGGAATSTPPTTTPSTTGTRSAQHSSRPRYSLDTVGVTLEPLFCQRPFQPWNNGKSGAKLDLTSSTTPGLQIHTVDHTRTATPCDCLPCRRAALPLISCSHSLVYLHLPVVEGLIFCISATPHLGTSFPLFHDLICTCARSVILETV